jgi:retinaldehyde-binding protein 1
MTIQDLLQKNYEKLLEQYTCNLEGVLTLQATLIRDILPSIQDELELGPEATEWAKEWLEDTCAFLLSPRELNLR